MVHCSNWSISALRTWTNLGNVYTGNLGSKHTESCVHAAKLRTTQGREDMKSRLPAPNCPIPNPYPHTTLSLHIHIPQTTANPPYPAHPTNSTLTVPILGYNATLSPSYRPYFSDLTI